VSTDKVVCNLGQEEIPRMERDGEVEFISFTLPGTSLALNGQLGEDAFALPQFINNKLHNSVDQILSSTRSSNFN